MRKRFYWLIYLEFVRTNMLCLYLSESDNKLCIIFQTMSMTSKEKNLRKSTNTHGHILMVNDILYSLHHYTNLKSPDLRIGNVAKLGFDLDISWWKCKDIHS